MSTKGSDLLKLSAVIGVTFALGITLASALGLPRSGEAQGRNPRAQIAVAQPSRTSGAATVGSFADMVDRVTPSVVFITTRQSSSRYDDPMQRFVPPEFRDFFRLPQQPRVRRGSGSGFIITRDGYIMTNNHVVEGAEQITVRLSDNREFQARVVGRDPNTDVAVIRIDAANLPAVTFGNSDEVRIGDWAVAIGNPLGFTFTVTAGIISAKGRTLEGLRDPQQTYTIQDFIQTDAAINPGNSGGPLVDINGNVIGVNSAIASQTGLYAGYGFAIPINLARRVMEDLIATGRVHRAILGINITPVTPDVADYVGLSEIRGVYVSQFPRDDSPARRAGIQLGDVIVAVNDTAVATVAQLQQMVGFRRPGETVRVTVVRREGERRGVRRTYEVRLIAAEEERVAVDDRRGRATQPEPREMEGRLGIRVQDVPADYARQVRLTEDQRGVLVADVEPDGPAWGRVAPPQEGGPELIQYVNNTRVRTTEEFERALRNVPRNGTVELRILNLGTDPPQLRSVVLRSR
ncbi:MAG TPA: Do family serine endopeptidase [Gemmatimonadales bacterium]|nr:Do family serine endopeptidase [Gemmatimonadales bacterium]